MGRNSLVQRWAEGEISKDKACPLCGRRGKGKPARGFCGVLTAPLPSQRPRPGSLPQEAIVPAIVHKELGQGSPDQ